MIQDYLTEVGLFVALVFVLLGWRETRRRADALALEQRARDRLEAAATARIDFLEEELEATRTALASVNSADKAEDRAAIRLPTAAAPPCCGNCTHFDLEEGQARMAENPIFMEATRVVTPAQMTRKREFDEDDNVIQPKDEDLAIPAKARWSEFGACWRHKEVRWMSDVCESYERMGASS